MNLRNQVLTHIVSSPEPLGSQGELIVCPCSVVRRSCSRRCCCSNVFSSETAEPIKAKLHAEHRQEGRMKIYINGQGHLAKMAAMAIDSKNH